MPDPGARPSLRYRALTALLHRLNIPGTIARDMAAGRTRGGGPPPWVETSDRFEHEGQSVYRYAPPRGCARGRVLHIHGGAFVYGLTPAYHGFAAKLAAASGAEVWLPDYPLPPDASVRAITAWSDGLAARAAKGEPLVLMGDSAGGGLALGAATRGAAKARALVLMSPWADLRAEPADRSGADEPLLSEEVGKAAAARYAGDLPPGDLLVSPGLGPLSGVPKTTIIAGQRDILWPEIDDLRARMEAAGADVTIRAEPQLGHYWFYYPVPEAKRTMADIAAIVRGALV